MKKGFTLIELLVIIAIVAILLAILYPIFSMASAKGRSNDQAVEAWKAHLQASYPGYTVVNATCVARDTDYDGYVSCSATLKDPSGTIIDKNMECSQDGCRVPKVVIKQ